MSEAAAFAAGVRQQLEAVWSITDLRDDRDADLAWTTALRAGWFDLGAEGAIAALVAASAELGALACPLPLADAVVASWFLPEAERRELARGDLRLTVLLQESVGGSGRLTGRLTEHADQIGAVLLLGDGAAALHPVIATREASGIGRPAWGLVDLGPAVWSGPPESGEVDRALVVLRLALLSRAAGAAERLHLLAVEHARTREQFGRAVGSFGAVQQRTASCEIDRTASNLLLDAAAVALDDGHENAELSAELASGFVGEASRRVLLGAHHTLAAVGYFEEHIGPWLFRRVHADVAMADALVSSVGRAVDRLVESGSGLPPVRVDLDAEQFRGAVRSSVAALRGPGGTDDFDRSTCVEEFARRGWFGMGWSAEFGGRSASVTDQVVLNEELTYARLPVEIELASVMLLGNAIVAYGTPEQQERFLPLIRTGQLRFCLGYSEPGTGSDLAGLRTRADRHPDGWLVNGQKIWTTRADQADFIWLAVRTDQDARPRHAGITVFLVPMSSPGITVAPMTALSGERAATVFLDDVVVPDDCRVGELGGGWTVITHALAGERVLMGGIAAQLHRVLDDVLAGVWADPIPRIGERGSARRRSLDRLVCDLQALRALVSHAVGAEGLEAMVAAPMAGVLGGELAESFAEGLVDIFGTEALLDLPDVIGAGRIEHLLRLSVMYVVGGGTNDIQRGLIARGLGLPR